MTRGQLASLVGIVVLAGGLEGWLLGVGRVKPWLRAPLAAAGFAFCFPGLTTTLVGGAACAALAALVWRDNRSGGEGAAAGARPAE